MSNYWKEKKKSQTNHRPNITNLSLTTVFVQDYKTFKITDSFNLEEASFVFYPFRILMM